jgi:hypothetical protein
MKAAVAKQTTAENELRQILRKREKLDRMYALLRDVERNQQKQQAQHRVPNHQPTIVFRTTSSEANRENATPSGAMKSEANEGNTTPMTRKEKPSSEYAHSPMSASPKFHTHSKLSLGPLSEAVLWSETAHQK